jgi:hypothetical protein
MKHSTILQTKQERLTVICIVLTVTSLTLSVAALKLTLDAYDAINVSNSSQFRQNVRIDESIRQLQKND